MSKCGVSIDFDRPDRQYTGGETVKGRVRVVVNQDVNSDGVVLEHFWRTHGTGNTATGEKTKVQLYAGPLKAGERLELPFDVTAPHGPPTYRGHHLNIDHYLKARVDIPWTIDPKQEEEYLLTGSGEPYGQRPKILDPVSKRGCEQFGVVIGTGMLIAGVLLIFPFGLVLIPGGLIVLFFSLRRKLAEKRLGPVHLDWGPLTVAPGGTLPLRLSFTPNKSIQLSAIKLTLSVAEECTSGSGTSATTHSHTLHKDSQRILGSQRLPAFQPAEFDVAIKLPNLAAYSFDAPDNKIYWRAELRIELPMWPDWIDKRELTVRPTAATVAEETESSDAWQDLESDIPSASLEAPAEASVEPAVESPVHAVEPPEVPVAAPVPTAEPVAAAVQLPLVGVLTEIEAQSRYSQERERIVERKVSQSFACPMRIRRTERTYAYDAQPPYRDGRTVYGILDGTQQEISVRMKAARNADVDRLRSGDDFQCQATPIKWNSLYDRLEMEEV